MTGMREASTALRGVSVTGDQGDGPLSGPPTGAVGPGSHFDRVSRWVRLLAQLTQRHAQAGVGDCNLDLALEEGEILFRKSDLRSVEHRRQPLTDGQRGGRLEVGARHLVDLHDEGRHRLEPAEERILRQQPEQLGRSWHASGSEGEVLLGNIDQLTVKGDELLRSLAKGGSELGTLW